MKTPNGTEEIDAKKGLKGIVVAILMLGCFVGLLIANYLIGEHGGGDASPTPSPSPAPTPVVTSGPNVAPVQVPGQTGVQSGQRGVQGSGQASQGNVQSGQNPPVGQPPLLNVTVPAPNLPNLNR